MFNNDAIKLFFYHLGKILFFLHYFFIIVDVDLKSRIIIGNKLLLNILY